MRQAAIDPLTSSFHPPGPVPCHHDPDLFDPPRAGERSRHKGYEPSRREWQAITICNSCPVINACQTWALSIGPGHPHPYDDEYIYGGMTGDHRRRYRKENPSRLPNGDYRIPIPAPVTAPTGCGKGHPAASRHRRSDNTFRCLDCDRENYERRKAARRAARQVAA